jgi:cytosine/adenosine deaminase-related metal-dependent hydrolase
MGFRKFSADQLFTGHEILKADHILITDEQGKVEEIVHASEAGDGIETFSGIISPGFINCHCHIELSHMKGLIPEQTGLIDFVLNVVQQRHSPEEEILMAIELAEDEMLANGIVAVGDICNNAFSLVQKIKGRMYYHNFIEASGFDPSIAEQRFNQSLEYFKAYAQYYSIPVESNSIVPHAPYSVADELWELIINFPGNHLLTMHNQETADENEWFINGKGEFMELYEKLKIDPVFFKSSGRSSLQTILSKFLILVHNVHTSEEDLVAAQLSTVDCRLHWCFCPNANIYISNQLPQVDLFIKHGCQIVLGTDSLASNKQLSILEEIKTLKHHFPKIELKEFLKWATINGANALQLDKLLGSFEKDKQPGVILIQKDLLNCKRIL